MSTAVSIRHYMDLPIRSLISIFDHTPSDEIREVVASLAIVKLSIENRQIATSISGKTPWDPSILEEHSQFFKNFQIISNLHAYICNTGNFNG